MLQRLVSSLVTCDLLFPCRSAFAFSRAKICWIMQVRYITGTYDKIDYVNTRFGRIFIVWRFKGVDVLVHHCLRVLHISRSRDMCIKRLRLPF